jgi:hypothetical protein
MNATNDIWIHTSQHTSLITDKARSRLPSLMAKSKKRYISNNQLISKLRFRIEHISSIYWIRHSIIGKSVKVLDKVGARASALKALEKLGAAQITHLKNLSSFKQLKTHIL